MIYFFGGCTVILANLCAFLIGKIHRMNHELRMKDLELNMALFDAKWLDGSLTAAESALRYHEGISSYCLSRDYISFPVRSSDLDSTCDRVCRCIHNGDLIYVRVRW